MEEHPLHRRQALMLFAVVVVSWGLNWLVTKTLVHSIPPLWTTSIRSAIATVALLLLLVARGQFIIPRRGYVPVIVATAVLHMVGFSALVAFGLQFVPVGRSVVLGYTTPLWVTPGAWLFLKEPLTRSRAAGVGLGLLGVIVMFNPFAFDWGNRDGLIGNGLILLAAFCWAANILYVRAHKWISTPFQLGFWQTLLATSILSVLVCPWLFVSSPQAITIFVSIFGAVLGPMFGIIIADYFLVRNQHVVLEDLYTMSPSGTYHYSGGWNRNAVMALAIAGCLSIGLALLAAYGSVINVGDWAWLIGAATGALVYRALAGQSAGAAAMIPGE